MVLRRKNTIGRLPQKVSIAEKDGVTDRKTYPDIAQRLQILRVSHSSENRSEWAQRNGFNVSQYINWENGSRRITLESAEALCVKYGVSLDWIYLGRWSGLTEETANRLRAA